MRYRPFLILACVLLVMNTPGYSTAQPEHGGSEADFWYNAEGHRLTTEELDVILARHNAWLADIELFIHKYEAKYGWFYAPLNFLLSFTDNPEGLRLELSSASEQKSAISVIMDDWKALCRDSRQADFSRFSLQNINFVDQNLAGAKLDGTDLSKATLAGADFRSAKFAEAKLNGIDAVGINLTGADLSNAELKGASFIEAHLQGVNFSSAKLQGANFTETDLTNAMFGNADLNSVIFEPSALTSPSKIAFAVNLDRLTYVNNPQALVELKKSLYAMGYTSQSKKVNATLRRKNQTPIEYLFYDLTCEWGSNHRRPLVILGVSWFLFGVLYWIFAKKRFSEPNRYILASEKGLGKELEREPSDWMRIKSVWRKTGIAFLFSLQRALRIGFREVSPSHWLMMLLPPDFEMKSRGWPRFVSGVQSLLSVALIVLSLLSYFGRPFEF